MTKHSPFRRLKPALESLIWPLSGPLKAQQGLGVGVDVAIGNETLKKTP